MQTQPATLSMASGPAFAPNRMGEAAGCGTPGLFEAALDALGAACWSPREPVIEDEGLSAAGPPSGAEEESAGDEPEDLAWPCMAPLALPIQPRIAAPMADAPLPSTAVAGIAGTGDDQVPDGLSVQNRNAPLSPQAATPIPASSAGQGARAGLEEGPPSGGTEPAQAETTDLLRTWPTQAALPRHASSAAEGRTGRVAPDDAGRAKLPLEPSASPCRAAVEDLPAPAQDTIRSALPAFAPVEVELGRPADLPAGALVLQAGMRDAPPPVPEATALHRLPTAEPHRQIADAIVRTRDGQVEVILNPVELGRVTVLLGAEGNPGHLALFVERPETLDLIRRHSDQLLRDLRDGGMPDPSLDILQQDSQGRPRDRGHEGEGRPAARDRTPDSPRQPAPRAVSLSRLDIRL